MGRGTRWLVAWMLAIGGFSGSAAAATEVEILMNKLVERGRGQGRQEPRKSVTARLGHEVLTGTEA